MEGCEQLFRVQIQAWHIISAIFLCKIKEMLQLSWLRCLVGVSFKGGPYCARIASWQSFDTANSWQWEHWLHFTSSLFCISLLAIDATFAVCPLSCPCGASVFWGVVGCSATLERTRPVPRVEVAVRSDTGSSCPHGTYLQSPHVTQWYRHCQTEAFLGTA